MKRGVENLAIAWGAALLKILLDHMRGKPLKLVLIIFQIASAMFVAHLVWSALSPSEWYYTSCIGVMSLLSGYIVEFIVSEEGFNLFKQKTLWPKPN